MTTTPTSSPDADLDLLFVGPEGTLSTLAEAASRLGVRLYPATAETAPRVLALYGGVLDGAVVCGGSAAAFSRLRAVAPRLPVAVLDLSAGSSPETLGSAIRPDAVLRCALEELTSAGARAEVDGIERQGGAWSTARPLASGAWTAHAALRLSGVAAPRSTAEGERFAEAAARWTLSLADVLSRLPRWSVFRVRYASVRGALRVGAVLTANGRTRPEAEGHLAEAQRHLGPLLRPGLVGDGVFSFHEDPSALLVPIRARAAVALRAPEMGDLAPLFETAHEDPWVEAGGVALAEGEADGVALPVSGPSGALAPLLRLLVGLDVPAVVDVTVRPAPLSSEERGQASDLARRASALMRTTPWDGPKRLARRAVQLAIESDHALAVEVTVAVEAPSVPASLVVEASRALVGDPATTRVCDARAEVRGGILVVGGRDRTDALSGRCAPDEAARSLRLPPPGFAAPGLRATHPARLQTPEALPDDGALIGHAPDGREVRVSAEMLSTHAIVTGATGTGKSTLAATLALELVEDGQGLLVMDPHGTLAAQIRDRLPAARREDLVWIDGGLREHGHRLNLLDFDPDDPASRDRVFDDLYSFFDAWYDMKDAGGPIFELHLREALRLLLHDPTERHALPSLVRMFTDGAYRRLLVGLCDDEETARFWRDAETRSDHAKISEVGPYVYSKVNRLLGSHAVRQMVSSPKTTADMDPAAWLRDGAVVLCTLPVGTMGAEGASVIGSVLLSRLVRAGFARLHDGGERRPFVAILDEAQRFAAGHEPAVLLAEGRKCNLGLVALTQRLSSLSPSFREAALANAGLVASMRVGVADAALLGPYLAPSFRAEDLLGLGRGEAAVRLQTTDGEPTRPFLLRARPPCASGGSGR